MTERGDVFALCAKMSQVPKKRKKNQDMFDKLDKFLGSDNKQNFFTRSQRSRLVFEILSNTIFGREKKGEVGIDRLVSEGAFNGAYPLHDV